MSSFTHVVADVSREAYCNSPVGPQMPKQKIGVVFQIEEGCGSFSEVGVARNHSLKWAWFVVSRCTVYSLWTGSGQC